MAASWVAAQNEPSLKQQIDSIGESLGQEQRWFFMFTSHHAVSPRQSRFTPNSILDLAQAK